MASPLHAAQNKQVELQARRAAMLADGSTATAEEKEALAAEIAGNDREIAAHTALQDLERKAPAASREQIVATPRTEKDPKRGFKSIGEFAMAVHEAGRRDGTAVVDERLAVAYNDLGDGKFSAVAPSPLQREGQSSEGFMVPPDYRPGIWKPAFENDDLLAMVNPQPTESNSVQFVTDETTPWGAAGVIAYWTAEGAQKTASKLGTSGSEVKLHKVAALVYATDEVLQDAPLLTSRINEAAPMAIAWTVSEAIMRGTGAGQPLGWENGGSLVTVAKETSQTAATIVPENLFKMHSRLLTGPGSRVAWLANRDTLPQIGMLKIGNEPSWTGQNKGLTEAPSGLLVGDPIRFTEHAQTLGTTGDVQLINFAGYAAFIRSGGTRYDSSIHLYFDYDITAFRWVMRVGGQPLLKAPVSPFKGSATKSHFVYLATRS